MTELPHDLRLALPAGSLDVAVSWWNSLTEPERVQLAGLWDKRLEVHMFTPQADESDKVDLWDQIPRVKGGHFVPTDDTWGLSEWGPGYFEHLLQHPELVILWEPAERTFHIGCTRHLAARGCLAKRAVPIDFACPAGSNVCPLEGLRGALLRPVV